MANIQNRFVSTGASHDGCAHPMRIQPTVTQRAGSGAAGQNFPCSTAPVANPIVKCAGDVHVVSPPSRK